jgi:hypothetical protein
MSVLSIYRSEYDPKESDEGGIDPLGLLSTGEFLAQLYLPGLLERHRRPGFLSLVAIGLSLKTEIENELGDKYETDFWEAFEWIVVTGLVKERKDDILNLPATAKAKTAEKMLARLNSARYLKAPSVFGFHGVYKFLSKNLKIEAQGQPGEAMAQLLRAWSEDRDLPGFDHLQRGKGSKERQELVDLIKQTIKEKQVAKDWKKDWSFIGSNFFPLSPGKAEKRCIRQLLESDLKRQEVLSFIVSPAGKKFLTNTDLDERDFLEAFAKTASAELKSTVQAIIAYETFARRLNDAFYDILMILAENSFGLTAKEISSKLVIKAPRYHIQIHESYLNALNAFAKHTEPQLTQRFEVFARFEALLNPERCTEEVLHHHEMNQQNKSTGTKNSWLFKSSERWLVRAGYAHRNQAAHDDSFLNYYRLNILRSFLSDLGVK